MDPLLPFRLATWWCGMAFGLACLTAEACMPPKRRPGSVNLRALATSPAIQAERDALVAAYTPSRSYEVGERVLLAGVTRSRKRRT